MEQTQEQQDTDDNISDLLALQRQKENPIRPFREVWFDMIEREYMDR